MSKAFDLLKEYGVFYLATVRENGAPAVRPFGAVMEHEGVLYICTANVKEVYKQLKAAPNIELAAVKPASHDWLRISGKAVETQDIALKEKMLTACPSLVNHFQSAGNPVFALFAITEAQALHYTAAGAEKL